MVQATPGLAATPTVPIPTLQVLMLQRRWYVSFWLSQDGVVAPDANWWFLRASCDSAHTPFVRGAKISRHLSVGESFMSGVPTIGSPAPRGLREILRSWLQGWSRDLWQSAGDLPGENRRPNEHFYGSVRVLVVDDNPVNLVLVSAQLGALGLVPWLATDGAEAVMLACAKRFDLILIDLKMSIIDGFTATSTIRRFELNNSRCAVPMIAYSSTAADADALEVHGLDGHLSKPCRDQELEDCLVRWCPMYRSTSVDRGFAQGPNAWQPQTRIPDAAPQRRA